MKKIALISRNTPQTRAFMNSFEEYIRKNALDYEAALYFYSNLCLKEETDLCLISPEAAVFRTEIETEWKQASRCFAECKPVDFGTKNIARVVTLIENCLNNENG